MPARPSLSWITFDELINELRAGEWRVKDRETAVAATQDGHVVRTVKKVIIAGDGVSFVADNSVQKGGDIESRDETTYAAFLAVRAVNLAPTLAEDSREARRLLHAALPALNGAVADEIKQFLVDGGPAKAFDEKSSSL